MLNLEDGLRQVTQKLVYVRGGARLIEPIRRFYVKRYAQHPQRCVVLDNFDGDMHLHVDRASYMGSLIYWRGYHSYSELRCLNKLLKPSMVFADVGANRGEFTVFAAKRLTQGTVLSFEPLDDNFQELQRNIQLNGFENVQAFDIGLADQPGERTIYTSDDLTAHGSWHEGLVTLFETDYRAVELGSVRLDTLDHVVARSSVDVLHGMKIDVEGAELSVLRGAEACLERHRPFLLLEINAETFAAAGYTKSDIAGFLDPFGYRLYRIGRHGTVRPADVDDLPELCSTLWMPPDGYACSEWDLQRSLAA